MGKVLVKTQNKIEKLEFSVGEKFVNKNFMNNQSYVMSKKRKRFLKFDGMCGLFKDSEESSVLNYELYSSEKVLSNKAENKNAYYFLMLCFLFFGVYLYFESGSLLIPLIIIVPQIIAKFFLLIYGGNKRYKIFFDGKYFIRISKRNYKKYIQSLL